jgi:hypothetical protein
MSYKSSVAHYETLKPLIKISKSDASEFKISFPYNPIFVEKVKTIEGRKWDPKEKYWSFPKTDGTLRKILKTFEGEKIYIEPTLQTELKKTSGSYCESAGAEKQSQFGDLRRELVSRKYSYKTVKSYVFYNRDLLSFTGKNPSDITENDIKSYLFYLFEKKNSATSTLNQAINALKFYYGSMLKKKFMYEVKRPRKDRKLPVVLDKEEIARILSSVDNIKHKAILMLIYSAGLRVGEVVKLKLEDIDGKRMLMHIKGSKGRKDRYIMLSKTALEVLRKYW